MAAPHQAGDLRGSVHRVGHDPGGDAVDAILDRQQPGAGVSRAAVGRARELYSRPGEWGRPDRCLDGHLGSSEVQGTETRSRRDYQENVSAANVAAKSPRQG